VRVGHTEEGLNELDRKFSDLGSCFAVDVPRTAEGISHIVAPSRFKLGAAHFLDLVQRMPCAQDDVLLGRDFRSREQSSDPPECERAAARSLGVDDRPSNMGFVEAEHEVDLVKGRVSHMARPVAREIEPALQPDLEGLRERRGVLEFERPERLRRHR
jgi:hypothetical protein